MADYVGYSITPSWNEGSITSLNGDRHYTLGAWSKFQYTTEKSRSSSQSIKIFGGGTIEIPAGVVEGNNTFSLYVWTASLGTASVIITDSLRTPLYKTVNNQISQWSLITTTLISPTNDIFYIRIRNLSPVAVLYVDDFGVG